MKTRVVCGGIYERKTDGASYQALCLSVKISANGVRSGLFHVYGFAPERMDEGSEALELWDLVGIPSVEINRKKKAS